MAATHVTQVAKKVNADNVFSSRRARIGQDFDFHEPPVARHFRPILQPIEYFNRVGNRVRPLDTPTADIEIPRLRDIRPRGFATFAAQYVINLFLSGQPDSRSSFWGSV